MRTNLPKEMNFLLEASNAAQTNINFAHMKTSLYIPEVIMATKRVLIMEYIQGGRVDDLAYLAAANIDRNKVALELSRIFNQMVFINGWFHAVSVMFDSNFPVSDLPSLGSSCRQPSDTSCAKDFKVSVQL